MPLPSAPHRVPANGDLHLEYQPLFQFSNEATVGFEALSRWTDPLLGEVPPETFISNSEQSGEIVQLGHQVLALLNTDFAALLTKYPTIRISLNASTTELNAPGFPEHFSTWLNALPPDAAHHLTLEVTETSLMQPSEVAVAYLHTLREMGIRMAIEQNATIQSLEEVPNGVKSASSPLFQHGVQFDNVDPRMVLLVYELQQEIR